ncbi:MAG: ribosome recycling factor [Candidatus Nomurabacteria bacterium]|nr:ribosome recycling factor [Candidatus Nomurabacteria bacterium]USN87975.1 MAG: ribosome recycling factor [Candidatus Nomurabacteria bacterium]
MTNELKQKLKEVEDWLVKEYAGIRTGQATPALLDSIKVESYGSFMPIQQVGSVNIEDMRTLRVAPWDASSIPAIERAIRDAELGVSLAVDSSGLRVIFPELTSERREQLLKLAKSKLEDARISVRSVRDETMKGVESQFKAAEISEDDKFAMKEDIQKSVEETNRALEALFTSKEAELQK